MPRPGSRRAASAPAAVPALALLLLVPACRQDMHDQHKLEPLERAAFFADGRGSRLPVPGTVARGELRADAALHAGTADGSPVRELPIAVDAAGLRRGKERYEIFCSPCHGRTGKGDGMVVRRGYRPPPTFHSDRLRGAPVGYLYGVIAQGFGAMPDYAAQVPVADRWRIVAWLRVLQLSQHAELGDVPEAERGGLAAAGER